VEKYGFLLKKLLINLLVNGFLFDSVNRISPALTVINAQKHDKIGANVKYTLFVSFENCEISKRLISNYTNEYNSTPVIVGVSDDPQAELYYNFSEFEDLLGGFLNIGLVLNPMLKEIICKLGLNELPDGLEGKPSDLLEMYVKECLQYLLHCPARSFGADRRYESLPDGVVLGKDGNIILFDPKAYSDGYSFSHDDIIRFAKYVKEFNNKYSYFLDDVYCFLVVSGKFNDSQDSIDSRSNSLYKECKTRLACITTEELGDIINYIKPQSDLRLSINWKLVFSNLLITNNLIKSEIKRIKKDKLI